MKNLARLVLPVAAIIFCGFSVNKPVVPQKYTNFSGKGSGFQKVKKNTRSLEKGAAAQEIDEVNYLDQQGFTVKVTARQQTKAMPAKESLISNLAGRQIQYDAESMQWINLDYNSHQLKGLSYTQQGASKRKESFLLLSADNIAVVFDFDSNKGLDASSNDYKSRRNLFLAQYTNHIK